MSSAVVIINPEAPESLFEGLQRYGIEALPVPVTKNVAPPLKGHPDLQLFFHHDRFFCHNELSTSFINALKNLGEVIICESQLGSRYPKDIAFNVACTGRVAFHREDMTERKIRSFLATENIPLVNVSQGYSKCSTCIVSENHIITADAGIHGAALQQGMDSLLINPGYILLPGYRHGFIGGATGILDNRLFFTGAIDHHPDAQAIKNFIKRSGREIAFLSEEPVIDLGSLFFVNY